MARRPPNRTLAGMTARPYGQQREMEDRSMQGTLAAQAEMIFPLERPLLARLGFGAARRLLDLGCGTGQFAGRVGQAFPGLQVTGLDLFPGHVETARALWPRAEHPWLDFAVGDATATGLSPASFDLVTVRHMLQAVPEPPAVLAEAHRLLVPGGRFYALAEDYMGILVDTDDADARDLFLDAEPGAQAAGTQLFHGRRLFRELGAAGFGEVAVHPLVVDTLNAPRETFARMLEHWRDGYTGFMAGALGVAPPAARARFDALIAAVRDPSRYACWLLLGVTGVRGAGPAP